MCFWLHVQNQCCYIKLTWQSVLLSYSEEFKTSTLVFSVANTKIWTTVWKCLNIIFFSVTNGCQKPNIVQHCFEYQGNRFISAFFFFLINKRHLLSEGEFTFSVSSSANFYTLVMLNICVSVNRPLPCFFFFLLSWWRANKITGTLHWAHSL